MYQELYAPGVLVLEVEARQLEGGVVLLVLEALVYQDLVEQDLVEQDLAGWVWAWV